MGTPPSPPEDAPATDVPAERGGAFGAEPPSEGGGAFDTEPPSEGGGAFDTDARSDRDGAAVEPASELAATADALAGADLGGWGDASVEIDESPEAQPVEGLDAEDPPEPPAAETEHFGWLPYAVLGLLVLLGLASFLGTLLR